MTIINAVDLDIFQLSAGGHSGTKDINKGACLLELAAHMAGESWTDHPECVSPVLTSYGIGLNDRLGDKDRQKLKQYLPGMLGTAGDGKDTLRRYMAADWAIRVATPRWLDVAGLTDHAATLRGLVPIVDENTMRAACDAARAVRVDAYAARLSAREGLKARIVAELKKQGKPAEAAAAADAEAVADAVAVADAADAAADAAEAVAAAAAVAVAVAADAAVAAADAVADAVAADAAAAVADAVAGAAESYSWSKVYNAVYSKLREQYRDGLHGSKFAEVRELNNCEGIELLGRMIDPTAVTR